MKPDTALDSPEEGKFNAGLDTLQDISAILKELRVISVTGHLTKIPEVLGPGKSQHVKYKLCKSLYIRAVPLIKENKRDDLRSKLKEIKVSWVSSGVGNGINASTGTAVPKGYYEAYNPHYDEQMDDWIISIVEALQDSGRYFMPEKTDDGL